MNTEELLPVIATTAMVAMIAFALWFSVSSYLARRREETRRRMAPADSEEAEGLLLRSPHGGSTSPGRAGWNFKLMIERTGLELTPAAAFGLMLLCGVILGGIAFVTRMDAEPWLAAPAFLLGMAIPFAFYIWQQGHWRRTLQQQLPDMIFLLARSLRAGRSLEQAIGFVGDSGVPPLAREFSRMHRQLDLGIPLDQVVRGAAERVHLADFYVFSSVLSLHRTTGGNLPVLLDRLAVATRDRTHFEGQYRAATILGRTSTGFIACMVGVILFYLFFFQRDWAMRFFDTTHGYTGIYLLATAAVLELSGLILLAWMLQHDY